jgi:soluble lytic murein transglycosylase-like protein
MKIKLIAVFLVMISFALFYAWGYQNGSSGRVEAQASITAKAAVTEAKLTEWVYAKSSKISKDTARQIVRECLKTEKPLLTIALISVESEFVPSATSNVGAAGLTQVLWGLHNKELVSAGIAKERRDLFNIDVSVKAGSLILNRFIKESGGDLSKALVKYLGGYNQWYKARILEDLGSLYLIAGGTV